MRLLSICSGIGGFDLAAEWAGIEVAGQVEIDPFCQQVLAKHWPHVPRIANLFDAKGDEFGTIDIVTAGLPCQPFSNAGKRAAEADDRYLWPELLRIIEQARPTWIVLENVTGFIGLALDRVCSDLENRTYQVETLCIPACAVNATHERQRVWVIAYSGVQPELETFASARAIGALRQSRENAGRSAWGSPPGFMRPIPAPRVLGTTDGVPDRVERVGALGNALVPEIPFHIFQAIIEIAALPTLALQTKPKIYPSRSICYV